MIGEGEWGRALLGVRACARMRVCVCVCVCVCVYVCVCACVHVCCANLTLGHDRGHPNTSRDIGRIVSSAVMGGDSTGAASAFLTSSLVNWVSDPGEERRGGEGEIRMGRVQIQSHTLPHTHALQAKRFCRSSTTCDSIEDLADGVFLNEVMADM